jgi:hypothetical protein
MSNKHEHEYYYYPDTNEEGWKCVGCNDRPGEPPGFSPYLDRQLINIKAESLLMDLCRNDLIYISNNSEGEYLTASVAEKCRASNLYDQYSILHFILEVEAPSHAEYWKQVSEGILKGSDPRKRCACGRLATSFSNEGDFCSYDCESRKQAALPF